MNIRTKFLIIFLVTAILPLAMLTTFTLLSSQSAISGKAADSVQTITAFKKSRTNLIVNSYLEEVELTATRPTLLALVDSLNKTKSVETQRQTNQYLTDIKQTLEKTQSISILNTQGTIIASSDGALVGKMGRTDNRAVDFLIPDNAQPAVSLKKPLILSGTTIGEVEFIDQGQQLATIVHDYTGLGETGDVVFARLDKDRRVTITSGRFKNDDPEQTKLRDQLADPKITQALEAHTPSVAGISSADRPFFYTINYLPEFDVALITKIDTREVFHASDQLRDNILVFALVFTLLIIMIILFFVHSITGPIAHLAVVAKKISSGDTTQRAMVLSNDEIGSLSRTFNAMVGELQEARVTLEKKVKDRTTQLEETNQELESFSYSVSHDLRAPLRAIDGFSKILTEDYADKIDDEGKRVIQTIINSTQQMGTLIDDLLTFSRLGRQDVKKQSVDMKLLAQEIFDQQESFNPHRIIHLQLKDMPEAWADASLIRQVWVNLISNAIKFTGKNKNAVIEIGAKANHQFTTYYVKDNGAGFDMEFVDKLFGVFQRLHDQKDFQGTGVGLAIIKRIVTKHGGKVAAEGKVGEGATLSFTLPIPHKNNRKAHE